MTAVVFDPAAFKVLYTQFAAVSNTVLNYCFSLATLILSNEDASPVQDIPTRTLLFNLLTAHIATLAGVANVTPGPQPVGSVTQATEGSVSAGFNYNVPPNAGMAYYSQTQYGAMYWQATTNLRSMRYAARQTYVGAPWPRAR